MEFFEDSGLKKNFSLNQLHSIDSHSMRRHLERQTLRKLVNGCLRHAVVGDAGKLKALVNGSVTTKVEC